METCSNPGCDHPGTNKCSACKKQPYCGPTCQTADWVHHKEECPGHLLKIANTNLLKCKTFYHANNYPQALHCANLAATKLKQLKDHNAANPRPIPEELIHLIDTALMTKYNCLLFMARHREALEAAKEWYCLWPTKHTHPPAIKAAFALVGSCIMNKEYADAVLYAHTTWETITLSRDSYIPEREREWFTATGALHLAKATFALAQDGGMPAEEKPAAGRETIMLTRRALEIHTRLHGAVGADAANDMLLLASLLDFFNDVHVDEALRLREQAKAVFVRLQGSLSPNVATCERNLGNAYSSRSNRAHAANDLDREVAMLELAIPHYLEAARVYRAINQLDDADQATQDAVDDEKQLRKVQIIIAATRG